MKFGSYVKKEKFEIGREVIISILISATISASITYWFNNRIDKSIANREYIYNFSRTFFDNQKYRQVSVALEENYLYNRGPIMKSNGGILDDYQIDDYLTHLTELYLFGEQGFVSFELLNSQFGYYVCITHQNREIQEYMIRLKSLGFENPSGTIDQLVKEMDISSKTDCRKIVS